MARNIRNCVWHTLYSIETALILITGRVPVISEVHCSAPVPGEPANLQLDNHGYVIPDAYLLSQRGLFIIIHEAVRELYNSQNLSLSQAGYQERVAHFDARLIDWKSQVPEALSFEGYPHEVIDATIECEVRVYMYHITRTPSANILL